MSGGERSDWDLFPIGESPFLTRGTTFSNLLAFVDVELAGGRARLFGELSDPALAAFVTQPFADGEYYDTLPVVPLCHAAARLRGQTLLAFTRELARFAVERDAASVLRGARRLSPGAMVEASPMLAQKYFTFVRAEVEKIDDSSYWVTSVGVPEFLVQFYMVVSETFLVHALALVGVGDVEYRWFPPSPAGSQHGVAMMQLRRRISWSRVTPSTGS